MQNRMKYLVFCFIFTSFCANAQTSPKKTQVHNASGKFVHSVFFKLKNDADKASMIKSLETFKKVDLIKNLEIGTFQDTGNPASLLTEYQVTAKMTFNSLADFRLYEKHPIHLASIQAIKDLLAAPPIGYDYFIK